LKKWYKHNLYSSLNHTIFQDREHHNPKLLAQILR